MIERQFLKPFTHSCYFVLLLLTIVLVSGCASDAPVKINDPLENRGSYDVHINSVSIPNPEHLEKPLSGKIYFPSQDDGASEQTETMS